MITRNLMTLPSFDEKDPTLVNVIVEAPCSSRIKFKYDPATDIFGVSYVLPKFAAFPFDFGFIPSTLAEDGDPIDIMVLMDAPSSLGCTLLARPIGVIEANQTQNGKTFRNDRLIGAALASADFAHLKSFDELAPRSLDAIEQFFISYNIMRNRTFEPLCRADSRAAYELIRRAQRSFSDH
jgi:inorganic pyrophosphatase